MILKPCHNSGCQLVLETWNKYVKKKYKKCTRNWNTKTGMGTCQPEDFSNFYFNDKWMVSIYVMDMKSNCCLYSSAKGTLPSYVRMELEFPTTSKATTKIRTEEGVNNDPEKIQLMTMKKTQSDISVTLSNIQLLLSSGKSVNSCKSRQMEVMKRLNEVQKYRLSIANGSSIDIISEKRKIVGLEV